MRRWFYQSRLYLAWDSRCWRCLLNPYHLDGAVFRSLQRVRDGELSDGPESFRAYVRDYERGGDE